MGEAKRRRPVALSRPQPRVGEAPRPAGRPTELLSAWSDAAARARQGKSAAMPVPCNGCTACCHQRVNINPARESIDGLSQHLDVVRDEHGYCLRRRDDGACIHLGPEGCTVYAYRPLAYRALDCRIFALPGNGASFPVGEVGKHTTPLWEFNIRSKRDALIRAAFILGAAPWLFHRRRDDCNTVMAAIVARFSHNAAIVEAMRAKTERQPAATRVQFFRQGMQRLLKLASYRELTVSGCLVARGALIQRSQARSCCASFSAWQACLVHFSTALFETLSSAMISLHAHRTAAAQARPKMGEVKANTRNYNDFAHWQDSQTRCAGSFCGKLFVDRLRIHMLGTGLHIRRIIHCTRMRSNNLDKPSALSLAGRVRMIIEIRRPTESRRPRPRCRLR